ncbi:MAG: hypothetical protein HC772_18700 [Leptolyngbyaceae cyanobacterium CRU_2_3]|nr:hypothetical protein [Leptolyngbyaceae cyanobacterium CRU_2_3]
MKPYNSFSESDAFFESNSAPATKIVLFKPENAYSQIVSAVKLRCKSSSVSRWNRFWDSLINLFCGSSEPRIDRKIAHDGTPYFHVYDPVTRRSMTLSSEQELRVWIDQRYYQ